MFDCNLVLILCFLNIWFFKKYSSDIKKDVNFFDIDIFVFIEI